jgi:hypothetical protein
MSDGVTVAQGPLEAFVLVRIQVGQPILPGERDENELSLADSAQNSAESESKSVRFPKVIRHRKSEATIYGKSKRYPFYRVVFRADGKRRMKSIPLLSRRTGNVCRSCSQCLGPDIHVGHVFARSTTAPVFLQR